MTCSLQDSSFSPGVSGASLRLEALNKKPGVCGFFLESNQQYFVIFESEYNWDRPRVVSRLLLPSQSSVSLVSVWRPRYSS